MKVIAELLEAFDDREVVEVLRLVELFERQGWVDGDEAAEWRCRIWGRIAFVRLDARAMH